MAVKTITSMTQTPGRGKPVVVLQGGTYDPESATIDPGSSHWLAPLHTSDRHYSWQLNFDDGTSLEVELETINLARSNIVVTAPVAR